MFNKYNFKTKNTIIIQEPQKFVCFQCGQNDFQTRIDYECHVLEEFQMAYGNFYKSPETIQMLLNNENLLDSICVNYNCQYYICPVCFLQFDEASFGNYQMHLIEHKEQIRKIRNENEQHNMYYQDENGQLNWNNEQQKIFESIPAEAKYLQSECEFCRQSCQSLEDLNDHIYKYHLSQDITRPSEMDSRSNSFQESIE